MMDTVVSKIRRTEVIIFTRFPEAGVAKTRLIPALGSDKAASLQRVMTEKLLAEVKALPACLASQTTIYFTGGDKALMAHWLGDHQYKEQRGTSLGEKMEHAFRETFKAGAEQAILVGADIPSIDTPLLSHAVSQVQQGEVVIGPTYDGGYYLIGLSKQHAAELYPLIFHNIAWSTSTVFKTTRQNIATLNITPVVLSELHDIDDQKDLQFTDLWKHL